MAQLTPSIPWPSVPSSPAPTRGPAPSLVPASLLPSPSSSLRATLRLTSRRLSPPSPSGPCSCFVTSHSDGRGGAIEELSWSGATVIWRRGGAVYRSFSFREHEQDVAQALFVDLEVASPPSPRSTSTRAPGLDGSPSTSSGPSTEPLFGPYRRPTASTWSDDPLPLPRDPPPAPPSPSCSSAPRSERTLLILLSTLAFAYPPSGSSVPFQLPFRVRRAWALGREAGGGVLLERATEGREVLEGEEGPATAGMPTMYTLRGVYDEMKPVGLVQGAHVELAEGRGGRTMSAIEELDEQVVFVSKETGLPLILSANHNKGKVTVWTYVRIEGGGGAAGAKGKGKEVDTLEDLPGLGLGLGMGLEDASFTSNSTSLRRSHGPRRARTSAGGGADITLMTSAGDRSLRRASTSTSAYHLPDAQASLLEALSASDPSRSALRRTPSHPPSTSDDRRTSITRNELSVTMDRMALSQGASSAGGGPGGGGDMDREATMFMSEEEQMGGERCEVGLRAVWDAELGEKGTEGMLAHLFDARCLAQATLAILLPSAQSLLLLSLSSSSPGGSLAVTPLRQLPALSATAVLSTRPQVLDLLVLKPGGEFGLLTANGNELPVRHPPSEALGRPVQIEGNATSTVVLTLPDGSRRLTHLSPPVPRTSLAQKVLETLAHVLALEDFHQLLQSTLHSREGEEEGDPMDAVEEMLDALFAVPARSPPEDPWSRFLASTSSLSQRDPLLPLLRCTPAPTPSATPPAPAPAAPSPLSERHQVILFALHLLVQDARLRADAQGDTVTLAKVVARLARAQGVASWVDAYRRVFGPEVAGVGSRGMCSFSLVLEEARGRGADSSSSSAAADGAPPGLLPKTPPDIFQHLSSLLSSSPSAASTSSAFDLPSVCSRFHCPAPSLYYGLSSEPLVLTSQILEIYSRLSPSASPPTISPSASTTTSRAQSAVLHMHSLGWTSSDLARLQLGVALPLREAVRMCQLEAPEGWSAGAYALIGRRDLERQAKSGREADGEADAARKQVGGPAVAPGIDELVKAVEGGSSVPTTTQAAKHQSLALVPRAARFNEDKRLEEVSRMLQFVEPVVVSAGDRTLDQLTPQLQQSILAALSHRTLALPVGAAMYHFDSRPRSSADAFEIAKINTSARIVPMPSPVALVEKELRDPASPAIPDRMEWPDFHSGVASALLLKRQGAPIDSSQISFNRPAELDARHAGLLMGLGLTGQLGSMLSSQAYDYLKAKHDPTSVGILLGLAVSYLGTSDPTVTSVISIHLPALHPPRSSSLNVSGMTRAASAVALGLVHFGTGRRSFADVLVRELCGIRVTNVEDPTACREAYALSAGFAFGMIMLGRGRSDQDSSQANEVDLLRVFRALILGESNHPLPGSHVSGSQGATDVNITSSAATIALALMFIRTERRDVADILEIPDSPRRLDYVRSDLLLLRTLARALILWTGIKASKEWVEKQLPVFVAEAVAGKTVDGDVDVARWSIVAGACFAVGFKFAGTATAEAHATLIHYMDRLTRASYVKATTVQGKIKRHALRNCLGVVSLALAMVMAGTGELNVLRRLRVAHGHFSEGVTYGYHLATHMALGLLFLGEARYTLGNSNGAVAALLLALYPAFPASPTENRAHLQAYRHLWILAAEPRYLEARDVDTDESVFLPVRLRLLDQGGEEVRAKQLVAPTLIPDVRLIDAVQVDSPRYWGFSLRLAANPDHFANFLRDSTLYVKRRTGHLSYAQDPRGIRSIFTRSKSETGSSVYDFGETARLLSPSAAGLRDFVTAFSDDAEAISATSTLCRPPGAARAPTAFEAFCASVLLECLTKDKRDVTGVYHAIYHAHTLLAYEVEPSIETLLAAEQLQLVVDFYKRGTFKALFGKQPKSTGAKSSSSAAREPLLHPAFVDHVAAMLSSRIETLTERFGNGESAAALKLYLSTGGHAWPDHPGAVVALALELARHAVPDLPALQRLKQLVVDAAKPEEAEGGELALRTMLRCTARTVEKSSGRKAWSSEVSDLLAAGLLH
ncbi:hypothetical protein JCM1841_004092 [Sporobolomyces salmonicolor]